MKISGKFNYNKAIKLSAERINELKDILSQHCNRFEIHTKLENDNHISFESFEELLLYDNFKERRIHSLEIVGYMKYERKFELSFEVENGFYTNYISVLKCTYQLTSYDEETLFKNNLGRFLEKIKTDYWLTGKFCLCSIVCLYSVFTTFFRVFSLNESIINGVTINLFIICVVFVFLIFFCLYLFDK